ncbi:Six-bladed beta-propeller, TolB-like protein [Cynara cardunculus var. scolymus]|uniref:Six-bladed beta-propeller, TolB-like protein n=1 Tax=Cynara cardunculus var. scolymus TaxID=59895 RepID=A0A103YCD3_CYNCS|nr:Six-bladed beta-propeller, TolB-like protein [Cynara cardunculus var. scolymus]
MATSQVQPSMLSIFVVFFCVYGNVVYGQFTKFDKLTLPRGVIGPEAASFRGFMAEGPFTTVIDGRIMKWQGPNIGFQFCDGTTDPDKGPICGRPLALSFQPITGLLYITDAYFGLLVVGPNGGLATQLAGGFKFASGLDVDLLTGYVYFIDASGGGPAVSADSTFVLVPKLTGLRVLKYWLVGLRANTTQVLVNVAGNPNKIKRAERLGEFWMAVSVGQVPRRPPITPQGVRINSNGVILQTVSFATEFFNKTISLVQEQSGKLYVGSRFTDFIGVYSN